MSRCVSTRYMPRQAADRREYRVAMRLDTALGQDVPAGPRSSPASWINVVTEERDGAVWAQMKVGPALLFAVGADLDCIQGCGGLQPDPFKGVRRSDQQHSGTGVPDLVVQRFRIAFQRVLARHVQRHVGAGTSRITELMLMIRPASGCRIAGRTAFVVRITVNRLTSNAAHEQPPRNEATRVSARPAC
jgi:hypothetical protein